MTGANTTDSAELVETPLQGLKAYMKEHQMDSIFERENGSDSVWCLFLHDGRCVTGTISENEKYEFVLTDAEGAAEKIHKVNVSFLCREQDRSDVIKQMKARQVEEDKIEGPHFSPRYRHHVKNKSLYPLMNRREVLFFKMLGGQVLRGVVTEFSRFEVFLNMKRGVPVVILRHAVLDLRDKKNRSYLKTVVEKDKKYW